MVISIQLAFILPSFILPSRTIRSSIRKFRKFPGKKVWRNIRSTKRIRLTRLDGSIGYNDGEFLFRLRITPIYFSSIWKVDFLENIPVEPARGSRKSWIPGCSWNDEDRKRWTAPGETSGLTQRLRWSNVLSMANVTRISIRTFRY